MPMTSVLSSDVEESWENLLDLIDERQVIPVVGGEVLAVEHVVRQIPLYRAVAEKLLSRYGLTAAAPDEQTESVSGDHIPLRPLHELNDAVCALARSGRRVQDLYGPVNNALRAVLSAQSSPIPIPLKQLAAIRHFDLFVSTTCDDLLARAIDETRFDGTPQADQIEYAPNLSSDRIRDIPERRSTGYAAVFHLFGKASASPQFAIHDEDILEFVYSLQTGRGHVPERMVGALRSRNLLLIGCNFADWLSRFFLRVANQSRLFGDRVKKEFLVDAAVLADASLTLFLERFSQNTRIFPGTAGEFVATLHRRWLERHPADVGTVSGQESSTVPRGRRGEIFVSYSSSDRPAARKLVEAIQGAGGDVVWFDRHDLLPGDDWRTTILTAIRRCSLFVPLISENTERRQEGFFRLEWDEACERDRTIQGRKFVLPVVIDAEYAGDPSRYSLIPEGFRKYQFSHAPGGEPMQRLRDYLVSEIRALRRSGSS
jgi:hypothetical protein